MDVIIAGLLGLMIVGFIVATIQNLRLRFRVWQMEKLFNMMSHVPTYSGEDDSGGGFGFYVVIFFILVVVFIWVFLGG